MTPKQIVEQLDSLTLADVYGALAYYHRHKDELDAYLQEIAAIHDGASLQETGARLQAQGTGVLFAYGSDQDFADSAQVIGDVEIGEESGVWMCTVIRGDVHWIRIGRRSNIQDGAVVHGMNGTHPTTIGDNVTIGHGAIIHGCSIGDQVLVGMGAIVMNGASVGSGSIVAAGTLVTEGMKVPPKSQSGSVVRLRGKGVAKKGKTPGDLYVHFQVQVPTSDDAALVAAVEKIAEFQTDDPRKDIAL